MYNIAKGDDYMSCKNLAESILLLSEVNDEFKSPVISDEMALRKSNEFYNHVLQGALPNIDDKINFVYDSKLFSFEGFCKPTLFTPSGISKVTIILPEEKSIKKTIIISHEKAHAYHMLSNVKTSETVPSFLDILNSIVLDAMFPGIKINNLNYKTKEAKKVAYLYLNKRAKYDSKKLEEYMQDYANALYLVKEYLTGNKKEVEKSILQNLLTGKDTFIYKDEFDLEKTVEFIKK